MGVLYRDLSSRTGVMSLSLKSRADRVAKAVQGILGSTNLHCLKYLQRQTRARGQKAENSGKRRLMSKEQSLVLLPIQFRTTAELELEPSSSLI